MIETIKPLIPWAALSVALWLAVYSVRRWFPRAWLWLEHLVPEGVGKPASNILLALPSVAFGAALAAFLSGEVSPQVAFLGAVSGAVAPIIHHALKMTPLPYEGPVRDAIWKKAKAATDKLLNRFLGGSLFLFVVGCGASTVDYELCRAEVRARFHADADLCSTPQCIDALSERELADLRGCR